MINKRFSLDEAYVFGFKTVANNFIFFLITILMGAALSLVFLMLFGLADYMAFKSHFDSLIKMFSNAISEPTGGVHVSGVTIHEKLAEYLPQSLAMRMDSLSLDISQQEKEDLLRTVLPLAIGFKLIVDVIGIGWSKIALDLQSNKVVSHDYIYKFYYLAPRVVLVNLIIYLLTVGGLTLLVIPGVFIFQRLRFARYFIIDQNKSVVEALRASWELTDKSVLHLIGYSIVAMLMYSLGNMLLLGVMFMLPLSYVVDTNVYRQMVKSA